MKMQGKLNEMLRKKINEEMEEQIREYNMMDDIDQKEALHKMLIYQDIVSYFNMHSVSIKEASALLKNDYFLDDLYDEWCEKYEDKCAALFEAFLKLKIAIEGAAAFGSVI